MGAPRAGSALKVAVGGLGTIGLPVARALDSGIPGLELAAVSARDRDKAERNLAAFGRPGPVVSLA